MVFVAMRGNCTKRFHDPTSEVTPVPTNGRAEEQGSAEAATAAADVIEVHEIGALQKLLGFHAQRRDFPDPKTPRRMRWPSAWYCTIGQGGSALVIEKARRS